MNKKIFKGIVLCIVMTILMGSIVFTMEAFAKEKITLSIWVENTTGNKKTFSEVLGRFESKHPDVVVKPEVMTWGDLTQKLTTTFAAGRGPDVVHLPNTIWYYADKGLVRNIDSYVNKWGKIDKFILSAIKGSKWNGHYYALPFIADCTEIFYNVDAFKKAGLETPNQYYKKGKWTWNTLLEIAKKLNNPPAMYALSTCAHPYWTGCFILQSLPTGNFLWDSKGNLLIDSPEGRRGFRFLLDLFHKYKVIALPSPQADYAEATRTFAVGRSAMGILGTWDIKLIKNVNPNLNFAAALMPFGPGGNNSTEMSINTLAIGANSKHPDLAWELLKGMLADDIIIKWTKEGYRNMSTKAWAEDPFVQNDPFLRIYAIGLKNGVLAPYVPEVPDMSTIVNEEIQAAIFKEKTMEQAIENMKKRIAASRKIKG